MGNPMYGVRRLGRENPFWGKHHSEETKEKIRQARLSRGISKETRKKISIANSGENHWNWNGGGEDYYAKIAHRVWEEYWREEAPKGYVIHHVDRNVTNNDICNLALVTFRGHQLAHRYVSLEQKRRSNIQRCKKWYWGHREQVLAQKKEQYWENKEKK